MAARRACRSMQMIGGWLCVLCETMAVHHDHPALTRTARPAANSKAHLAVTLTHVSVLKGVHGDGLEVVRLGIVLHNCSVQ
jgi:hypothetical protein